MWVMIRMPEGRLLLQVPRQLSSLVMSGRIGLNLSALLFASPSFFPSGAEKSKFHYIYQLKVKAKE